MVLQCTYPTGYSRIRVKDNKWYAAGTYQKASGLINNRSYWNQIDGEYQAYRELHLYDQALWWDNITNTWTIGHSRNGYGGIISVQDSACPTSEYLFKYFDGTTNYPLAPINSVSIQCV